MRSILAALCVAFAASCAAPEAPATLSEWGLFADVGGQVPAPGVEPYEINAPLFSDHAEKRRFIRLPPGGRIRFEPDGTPIFPEGTVIAKSFGFAADLRDPSSPIRWVETRLLILEEGRWTPHVYLFDADGREARLHDYGQRVPVALTDPTGAMLSFGYRVPNVVQCANCHGGTGDIRLLGPRLGQIDRVHDYPTGRTNQLTHFVERGWLDARPPESALPDYRDTSLPTESRARSYLEANCAHCHRAGGAAEQSGLWLTYSETEPLRIGICKPPVAAGRGTGGRRAAIVPGDPEASIMVYRMESTEAGVKMPELPSVLSDPEGVALVRAWIAGMPAQSCD